MSIKIEELAGSLTLEDLIEGLLSASGAKTLGDIWSKYIDCHQCKFEKECMAVESYLSERGKSGWDKDCYKFCGQFINYKLGNIKLEDIK